jgi:hypothetical protein
MRFFRAFAVMAVAWAMSHSAWAFGSGQPGQASSPTVAAAPGFLQEAHEIFYSNYFIAPDDIDGDGISDLLWFNSSTSQFAYWISSPRNTDTSYARSSYKIFNITPGYHVGAVGDFNGDRKADLIWTSAANDLYFWASQGVSFKSTYIRNYPPGWKLLGAGDIDGDGDADLLWWNESSCQFGYWIMHGAAVSRLQTFNVTCGYHVAAVGHFLQTAHLDLLWTSSAHDLYLWAGNGSGFSSSRLGTYAADGTVVGAAVAGDFGGLNVYVKSETSNEFSQYERVSYYGPDGHVTQTTFGLVQTLPLNEGDYLGAMGNFGNGNEAVLIWANDSLNADSSPDQPGSFDWFTRTFSPQNQGWLSANIGSYPTGWRLVGAQN